MRIEELHLKNFRCFKELDIRFPDSNLAVFIGWNGSGKTAILDAILLLLTSNQKGVFFKENTNLLYKYNLDDISIGTLDTESEIFIRNEYRDHISWKVRYKEDNTTNIITDKIDYFLHPFSCIHYTTNKKDIYTISNVGIENANFDKFDEWFIEEENIENQLKLEKKDFNFSNPRLNAVRKAIVLFISNISSANFHNLKAKRNYTKGKKIGSYEEEIAKHSSYLVIQYNNEELKISQLSEGQRLLIHLVGDIAYRLVMLNWIDIDDTSYGKDDSYIDTILNSSDAIILIDEIELHLHPQWQREVLPALQKTFPNIQFIVTTHSPQVLSRVHRDDIFILKDNQLYQPSSNPVGRDSTDILDEIMEVTKRPEEIQKLSDEYFSLINKNQFEEAQKIREQLLVLVTEKELDEKDPIFIRADGILARKQLLKR
jgi:predicted ATP-binding protein involved in virulence